jgi:membrane protein
MKVVTFKGIKGCLKLLYLLRYLFRECIKDNCPRVAAALTYITILSLVPLVAISLSVLSRFETSQEVFLRFVFQFLIPTPSLQEVIVANIEKFARQTTTLSIIGGLFFIITSVYLLNTVEGTFNQIWVVTARRSLISKFTSFWSLITLSPILITVALILSLQLTTAPLVGSILKMAIGKVVLHYFLPYFLTFLAIFIIYRILPHTRVKVIPAIIGALIATFLFQVARWGFEIYITEFTRFDKIYGMLGTLPMFFIWVYICWLVILFGGEVTYTVQNLDLEIEGKEFSEGHTDAYHGLRVMMAIGRNFLEGNGATSVAELAEKLRVSTGFLASILNRLKNKGIVHAVEEGRDVYLPARSLDRITVQEVMEAIRGNPFHVPPSALRDHDGIAIEHFFQEAQKKMMGVLKRVTIEALLRKFKERDVPVKPSRASNPPVG